MKIKYAYLWQHCQDCEETELDLTVNYCPNCGSENLIRMDKLPKEKLLELGWSE